MNRDLLTLLGCSGSLLVVLAGNPANAILPPGAIDGGSRIDVQTVHEPIVQEAPQVTTQAAGDRINSLLLTSLAVSA